MLIPATRYRDPEAALAFLRDVLGLTEHAVHRDADGRIVHVEMALGTGLMMFGPDSDSPFQQYMVHPDQTEERETTTIYAVVDDLETHYARCLAAGVKVLMPLEDQPYGGANFTVADAEGHVWSFGDYDPRGAG